MSTPAAWTHNEAEHFWMPFSLGLCKNVFVGWGCAFFLFAEGGGRCYSYFISVFSCNIYCNKKLNTANEWRAVGHIWSICCNVWETLDRWFSDALPLLRIILIFIKGKKLAHILSFGSRWSLFIQYIVTRVFTILSCYPLIFDGFRVQTIYNCSLKIFWFKSSGRM